MQETLLISQILALGITADTLSVERNMKT